MRMGKIDDVIGEAIPAHVPARSGDGLEPLLLQAGLLDESELARSIEEARRRGVPLWDLILDEKRVSEAALAEAFSRWLRVPYVRLKDTPPDPAAWKSVNGDLLRKHQSVPLRVEGRFLVLAMANPADYAAIQEVEFQTGQTVRVTVAARSEILDAIEQDQKSRMPIGEVFESLGPRPRRLLQMQNHALMMNAGMALVEFSSGHGLNGGMGKGSNQAIAQGGRQAIL